jgi:hypothetical protein
MLVDLPLPPMTPPIPTKVVAIRLKKAKPSQEQRKHAREQAHQAAQDLQKDINDALTDLQEVVQTLSHRHNRTEDFIAEQLHLGGHVIKQKRAPGINNAYAHCEARCENECQYLQMLFHLPSNVRT